VKPEDLSNVSNELRILSRGLVIEIDDLERNIEGVDACCQALRRGLGDPCALDVNHHPSAINVADLQASQLRVPNTGGIEGYEESSMKWCASRIDELGHYFLTENGG